MIPRQILHSSLQSPPQNLAEGASLLRRTLSMSMLDEKTHLGPYNLGALTHRTLSSRTPSCSSVEETPEKKQNIPQALRKAMAHPAIPEKITKAFEGAIIKGDFQYTDRGNIWVISIGKAEHTRTFELQKQPMAL